MHASITSMTNGDSNAGTSYCISINFRFLDFVFLQWFIYIFSVIGWKWTAWRFEEYNWFWILRENIAIEIYIDSSFFTWVIEMGVMDDVMLISDPSSIVSINLFIALICLCIVIGHLLEENRWVNESITALVMVIMCFW